LLIQKSVVKNTPFLEEIYPASLSINGFIEEMTYEDRTVTGSNPLAWIAITLPEPLLIRRVRAFTFKVKT
jgi:hypothetical protein